MIEQLTAFRQRRDAEEREAKNVLQRRQRELIRAACATPDSLTDDEWQVVDGALTSSGMAPDEVVEAFAEERHCLSLVEQLQERRKRYTEAARFRGLGSDNTVTQRLSSELHDCVAAHSRLESLAKRWPLLFDQPGPLPPPQE